MLPTIRTSSCSMNLTPGDYEGIKWVHEAVFQAARNDGSSLLLCPELSLTSYGCEDGFLSPETIDDAELLLSELLPATSELAVVVGMPIVHNGALFNAAVLVIDTRIVGVVCKKNLAADGIHYESRWFKAWPEGVASETTLCGQRVPIGDLVFDINGVVIGFEICEDAFSEERPRGRLVRRGCNVILNPSASHFSLGSKHELRKMLVREGSRSGVFYLYANHLGNNAGRAIYDGGLLAGLNGALIAQSPRFSYGDYMLTSLSVDLNLTRSRSIGIGSLRPEVMRDPNRIFCNFEWPSVTRFDSVNASPHAWEAHSAAIREEEFSRAVSLALFDYARKTGRQRFVVSLSGGADSAACAVLCHLLVRFGLRELGEQFARRFGLDDTSELDPLHLTSRLLATAYQGTKNSSTTTRTAAATLATAIGAAHYEWNVDDAIDALESDVTAALGITLNWEEHDIALQNIQARLRAPGIWLLTNLQHGLLLSTSNRSEAAVGYATMDGDTAGGLSPIAGIDKVFLRHWLRWMETTGPTESGLDLRIPALQSVNSQAPTAELRPEAAAQSDEADLMPYPVLNAFERAIVVDKAAVSTVCASVHREFERAYSREQIASWAKKFYRLWYYNQWKRERYCPSFHLDDVNLDPKTAARMPILNGAYPRTAAKIDAWLQQ